MWGADREGRRGDPEGQTENVQPRQGVEGTMAAPVIYACITKLPEPVAKTTIVLVPFPVSVGQKSRKVLQGGSGLSLLAVNRQMVAGARVRGQRGWVGASQESLFLLEISSLPCGLSM